MRKICITVLCTTLLLFGCKNKDLNENTNAGVGNEKTVEETEQSALLKTGAPIDEKIQIGIIQLVQHDALDASRDGFIDELAEQGYIDGENIQIDLLNAQGEIANANTIAEKFVNDNKDLILAIATPAAQAVANATSTIPILFTSVTDAVEAGLIASNEAPGGNITGTSDVAPIKEQIDLLMQFAPHTKTIGLLYCSNEANSYIQMAVAKQAIEDLGISYKEFTVSETNQIQQVVETAVGQVDALYTCTDNMIASSMSQVSAIAIEHNTPIIVGEPGQVEKGALATYGISYYELGKATARQAVKIIEGADPATMPVERQTEFELKINENTLNALNLTMPINLNEIKD